MEEKKWFLPARKSVFTSRKFSKLGFSPWFPLAEKKSPNKRNWFPLAGMKNLFKNTFTTRRKNCLHCQEYLKNKRKLLTIAVIRVLNTLSYNLNNGFH